MISLSDKQKALLFQGRDKWRMNSFPDKGIPEVLMSDGPNGLRIEAEKGLGFSPSKPAVAFPTESLMACSFDRELLYSYGKILAEECRENHINVLLGPGVCHKRSPLCGRNFEYFSEDPVLAGELAASYINGVQDGGVAASLKHFAGNSREKGRQIEDSIIDERTLQEIYLKQFRIAVRKSHPWTIMPAYNLLNGVHCTENRKLLDEGRSWGFDGAYISDWGAVYDPVESIRNGLNVEMPGGDLHADEKILKAQENGEISENCLSESTDHILKLIERCTNNDNCKYDRSTHLQFARKAAEDSAVLLRNENAILPLHNEDSIALIGYAARKPRYTGSGSSHVNSYAEDSLFSAMKKRRIAFAFEQGCSSNGMGINERRIKRAVSLAAIKDKVIVCCALPEGLESEGYDRTALDFPADQLRLIEEIEKVNQNIVVIIQSGAPVLLPFRDKVKGILLMYLGGCQSGKACLSLLYGDVNPSGKLAETWPKSLESTPSYKYFDNDMHQVQYREGIFTGYRYYDTFHIQTSFVFGSGLSYTSFLYRNMSVSTDGNTIHVSVVIENTGSRKGKETVMLFAGMTNSRIARADHELIDFEKIELDAGKNRTAEFTVPMEKLAYYDTNMHAWSVEEGEYILSSGSALDHLYCNASVCLKGNSQPYTALQKKYLHHAEDGSMYVSDDDYACMLGHAIPEKKKMLPMTQDTAISELSEKKLGSVINLIVRAVIHHMHIDGTDVNLNEMPIRSILWLDHMNWDVSELAVSYMNKHSGDTLKKLIRAYKKVCRSK